MYMKEGLKRMTDRVQKLLDGNEVPVIERHKNKIMPIITGWEPARYEPYTEWESSGTTVDQNGTQYRTRVVHERKGLHSGWESVDEYWRRTIARWMK